LLSVSLSCLELSDCVFGKNNKTQQ